MRKIIAVGLVTIFLLSGTIASASVLKKQIRRNNAVQLNMGGAKLDIEILDNFYAKIKNTGDKDATNVKWNICLQALILVGGGCKSGSIEKLKPGEETTIHYPVVFLIGFGPLVMKVTASADNAEKVIETKLVGFLLGPLILSP
ncbi:MAG: hypothetical protein J7K62_00010 [Thermoplasmata archaeon]|nr:hypothetical protein [Thermoplasmata archaeon]